jgi:aspartate dehydrogenase
MRVCVIGRGPIAGFVARHIEAAEGLQLAQLLVRPGTRPQFAHKGAVVTDAAQVAGVDVIADCAGVGGLAAHGPFLLTRGFRLVTLSAAAFADPDLEARLVQAARQGGGGLVVAAGAIGAVDALAAAKVGGLARVSYTGRKPPAGWTGTPAEQMANLAALAEPLVHFEGSAREAAKRYPKNANVAATIALAGAGFEATTVRLVADPAAQANTHTVEAEGAFGRFSATFEARALPDNPRSSALAAMSMVRAVTDEAAPLKVI